MHRRGRVHSPCAQPVPSLPMQAFMRAAAAAAATTKRLRNAEEASRLSHTWRSHTLACSQPSRSHPRTPPARNPASILRCPHALSSAASCFRGDGLVHQQQGSAWLSKQVRARCLPRLIACDPWLLSCSLGAPPSDLLHFLRVWSAGLETKR